ASANETAVHPSRGPGRASPARSFPQPPEARCRRSEAVPGSLQESVAQAPGVRLIRSSLISLQVLKFSSGNYILPGELSKSGGHASGVRSLREGEVRALFTAGRGLHSRPPGFAR